MQQNIPTAEQSVVTEAEIEAAEAEIKETSEALYELRENLFSVMGVMDDERLSDADRKELIEGFAYQCLDQTQSVLEDLLGLEEQRGELDRQCAELYMENLGLKAMLYTGRVVH